MVPSNLDQSHLGTLGGMLSSVVPSSTLPPLKEVEDTEPKEPEDQQELARENERLKDVIKTLQARIHALETAAQENNMLKSSIINLREEFNKHAGLAPLGRANSCWPMSRAVSTTGRTGLGQQPADKDKRHEEQVEELQARVARLSMENRRQASVDFMQRYDFMRGV
ncbi:hypothetical protein EV182_002798 [Spiromyces aspiralis]|uniref:Uncharacterized protein n=1 Tax=Spiromyces aspiralis TaxID=68401 RepID=A0ACC1HR98_9FUNG|nr:hypothetical protein EV182_002798 [Spiromyces aspiralis]